MAIVGDRITTASGVYSPEAASYLREFLQTQVGRIIENGLQGPYIRKSREHFCPYIGITAPPGTDEYKEKDEQRQREGYIESVGISRDVKTGRITAATINKYLPADNIGYYIASMFNADTVTTRVQLPSESNRAVIDSWRTPYTHVALAARALSGFARSKERRAAHNRLHRDVCVLTDSSNIPLGAIDINHLVLGRDGDYLEDDRQAKVVTFMEDIDVGVTEAIIYRHS